MRIGVVIQARTGSSRLPGKVLLPIAGEPLLAHILGRLKELRAPAKVVVATSDRIEDDAVASFCTALAVSCFRGSERDVLLRYLDCTRANGFDQVVRLTGDNPFPDIEELDRLIELHLAEGNDFTTSFEDLPVGVGAEIFTAAALEISHREGLALHHREHVDEFILENLVRFRTGKLKAPATKRYPQVRLTVDTLEDFERAQRVATAANGRWVTTEEAIAFCLRYA